MEDSQWQVCPTGWVDAAMARWRDLSPKPPMDSLGVDVARGGRDNTILQGRHGMWFDKPKTHPGKETPDGPLVAGLAIGATRDAAVIHIDVIGVGSSPFDFLVTANQDVVGVNVSEASAARDQSGAFGFYNLRSELVWKMREALDPANNTGIALPPDQRLRADLCAFTWTPKGNKIYVRSTDEVKEKIGRSPDFASAAVLALIDTPKRRDVRRLMAGSQPQRGEYDPFAVVDGMQNRARAEYDPFANLR
jgi:hypothetical protein